MRNANPKVIQVFADWETLENAPQLVGTLTAAPSRGREIFSFEYNPFWLEGAGQLLLDPALQMYEGQQYPKDEQLNFGMFTDSCPDKWGRFLMKRREALRAREEGRDIQPLRESDYLLGVYDQNRSGALRFCLDPDGPFLDNNREYATPPWTALRELESASNGMEKAGAEKNINYSRWLQMLIAPGGSLGGARPKAGVVDIDGHLWIAKFPSQGDGRDWGIWELLVLRMAQIAGIDVSPSEARLFRPNRHTFLTKRFDRTERGGRIHYASAMTMLGRNDGEDAFSGASYLEIAEFLMKYGASPDRDLEQLWRRIVFNICVSNTDDHLRNHGFLLSPHGWRLSPAFDMNPDPDGDGLKLNISESENAQDFDIVMEVINYFRLYQTKLTLY